MLIVKNLSKNFKRKKVLSSINLNLDCGVYCVLGPNGAGKTTLFKCLTGLYNVDDGEIIYEKKKCRNFGYLPQKFGMFDELTSSEMMELFANLKKIPIKNLKKEVEECIEIVGLSEKANEKIGTLSGGMIRRLGIAQTLLGNPEIIFLDEPTAGLDPEERIRFKNIINKIRDKHIIVISTHIVDDVENLCDKIIIMDNGGILFFGTREDLIKKAADKVYTMEEIYKDKIEKPYVIQEYFEENNKKYIRFVTSTQPQIANTIQPKVEDGYICILKNI